MHLAQLVWAISTIHFTCYRTRQTLKPGHIMGTDLMSTFCFRHATQALDFRAIAAQLC